MTDRRDEIVEIVGVTKRFPGVIALNHVSVEFRRGEVHAVVGENGAGKSTLINVLAGEFPPNEGELRIDGKPVRFASPLDSRAAGIVVVYQELALCPTMSVAENVMMSEMAARPVASLVPRQWMRTETRAALERLGMPRLDPDAKIARLSIAGMQLVEIAAAVRQRAQVLVLDEPNSAISKRESEQLFDVVRQLRSEGVAVVYVSHRLAEVLDLADRISVMRDGRLVETMDNRNVTEDRLIRAMVGRDVGAAPTLATKAQQSEARVALSVEDLAAAGIEGVSFAVRSGEILGVAGLPDSGKDELGAALFGLLDRRGSVAIDGAKLRASDPTGSIRAGMFFVPADRRGAGGFLTMTIAENVIAASLSKFSLGGFLRRAAINREARAQVARLHARIGKLGDKLGTLSGGNQQKILLGRSLVTYPRVLVLHEPTRGIDVGAKAEIYAILRGIAAEGVAIVLITSEIAELIANADRVLVMRNGRISGDLAAGEINEEAILTRAMAA
ncbi:MAG TPA: sugar ABC transporter ATP-binding protein [Roseiarcus sp.]|jgi:ribose transport system ATP-binding protein|nr:sugar ABC transporter ATP-binding protein [Roseiarcus sp.]